MTLLTPENTLACREQAEWTVIGAKYGVRSLLPRRAYRVPIELHDGPGWPIVERLGAVKPRGDGRWSWWRWRSKFHKGWETGQGVVATEELAKAKVLEGWA
jgi:hypothetical protein